MRLLLLFSALITALLTGAIEFKVPSTWKDANITEPTDDRRDTVEAAIQVVLNELQDGKWASDTFYSVLALHDMYNNQTSYEDTVVEYFSNAPFQANQLRHGVAAMRAYQVYRSQVFLSIATESWGFARGMTISEEQASAQAVEGKTFQIASSCEGATLAGGTFWDTNENKTTLVGFSTAMFFTLSAYLSQATGNVTYLDSVKESGAFMLDNFNVTEPGNGKAAMSAKDGDVCTSDNFGGGTFRLDHSAHFMEGLAILPEDITLGKQSTSVESLRATLVNITLTTNPLCNAEDGIINVGSGKGDGPIVIGLGILYHLLNEPSDLLAYVGGYLSIQYNTILKSATQGDNNIYTGSWIGPAVSSYNEGNQTLAVSALVSGAKVNVADKIASADSASEGPSGSDADGNDDNRKPTLAGPIAGGVVGGLVILTAIILAVFYYKRRQRAMEQRNQQALYVDEAYNGNVPHSQSPFLAAGPTIQPSTGLYEQKRQQSAALQWSRSPSYGQPASAPVADAVTQVPTDELLRLLQERLQREGGNPNAPPAYEPSHRP